MPIRFRCPSCKQVLSVTSRKAGQRVNCPACQAAMMVPAPVETPVAEEIVDEEPASETVPAAPEPEAAVPDPEPEDPVPPPIPGAVAAESSSPVPDPEPEDPVRPPIPGVVAAESSSPVPDPEPEDPVRPPIPGAVAADSSSPVSDPEPEDPVRPSIPEPVSDLLDVVAGDQSEEAVQSEASLSRSDREEVAEEQVVDANPDADVDDAIQPAVIAATTAELLGAMGDESDEDDGFSLRRAETEFDEMDLTPMVDVTFLLLIFFMITASFSLEKAIAFPPPSPDEQGAAAEPKQIEDFQDKSIIVEIQEDNSIWIDGEPTAPGDEITELLKRKMVAEGKTELLVDAHDNALHETVVRVVDAGNEVEMQRIRLGARGGS